MNIQIILQLRNSVAIMQELQQHEENPDKWGVYEKNIQKLQEQIKKHLPTPAHSPLSQSRMPQATPSAPLRGGYAVPDSAPVR